MTPWRLILETDRAAAEAAATVWDEAMVPEILALSIFESPAPGTWRVEALYASEAEARDAVALLPAADQARAASGPLPDEDWVAKSLEGLPPIRARRFLVHGAHQAGAVRVGDIPLRIEAGAAFGTGHHGTTRGCLDMLDRLARRQHRPRRIVDVGCGTGVLAIAAAKRFRVPVLGVDLDPDSVAIAGENARVNACAPLVRFVTAGGTRHSRLRAHGPYDIVFANILMGPLIDLSGDLAHAVAPDGMLILSGLLVSQETRVLAAYRARGLRLRDRIRLEGWSTLALSRRPA